MQPDNGLTKTKKIIYFLLILLATTGITGFLVFSLLQKQPYLPVVKNSNTKQPALPALVYTPLLSANEVLAARLNSLQQSDQQYADLLTTSNDKKLFDSINQHIYVQEEFFRGSIDSIFLNTPTQADSGLNKFFNNIVSSYKLILQNRRSVSSLRNAISLGNISLTPDGMATLKAQNELRDKNSRIASLESELKITVANNETNTAALQAAANENIATLKDNITAQENKIITLNADNNTLKQDNNRIIKQQNDATKMVASSELIFKNKSINLQQQVEVLNAELRLAQVDCNLTRVDAKEIISNARQRKELLSEASTILTSLSQSDDAGVKKKVQDKIARLNTVAANSRD